MSGTTITVPENYGYVILSTVVLPWFVSNVVMAAKVMKARKKCDVKYPNLYATPGQHKYADDFNRVQRGHQKIFESLTHFTIMSLIGGLKHPVVCSVGGVFYCLGNFLFQKGYADTSLGVDKARHMKGGPIQYIGIFGSLGSCISIAASMCGWI